MKILPRFKKFKKKRQEQLQKKETEDRDITEHSSQESLQCSDENVGLENVDVTNATDDFDKKVKELIECCAFLECLQCSDENVVVANTTDEFYTNFKELIEGYENDEGEFIDMSQPRDASYATNFDNETNQLKRKDIQLTPAAKHKDGIKNESKYSYRSMDTEFRGITLRQLRAILPLIKRRCEEEKWTRPVYKDGKKTDQVEIVTLENATLYDINKYIIKPFTDYSKKSFVETLPSTKGTQPPRWFVSHYWGETFVHTMACLEQMVEDFCDYYMEEHGRRGGGMREDTPLWICAFANNQHNLESEITSNPADSAFAKAMKIAKFRVISILDVNNQVYTRLWCMYELYLTLLLSKGQGLLGIYTYHEHNYRDTIYNNSWKRKAVGLVEGGATSDGSSYDDRQKHFPLERLLPFLTVSIQNAVASRDKDRKNIMNSIHGTYDELNDAIRGAVLSSQATLNLIYKTGRTNWDSALSVLKKSSIKVFEFDSEEMLQISKKAMAQVFHNLPSGLEKLSLQGCPFNGCPHGRVAMDALLDWLENDSTNLKKLWLSDTCIGGEIGGKGGKECGERLAKFLARDDCKIEYITLKETDLVVPRNFNTWIECLEKNQSLRSLDKKTLKEEASWRRTLNKTKQKEANTVDNEVQMIKESVLEKSTAKTEQEEAQPWENKVNVVEETVLEERNAAGGKSTSNWLRGVISCF